MEFQSSSNYVKIENSKMKNNSIFLSVAIFFIINFVSCDKERLDSYYSQSESEINNEQIKISKGTYD